MNKVAQEKARSAVEFLSSVDPDVLREIHPDTRERLIAKLTEAFPRKAQPSRIEEQTEEAARAALCAVLERIGADGACARMIGDTSKDLSDAIFVFVRGEQERIGEERDNALTQLSVVAEVIGEVRGVCKAGEDELTVLAVRRAFREAEANGTATTLNTVLRRGTT